MSDDHAEGVEVLVAGSFTDLEAVEASLDAAVGSDGVSIRSASTEPVLRNAVIDAVIVAATGGSVAAVKAVLVEIVKSRRVSLTWREGDHEVHFEGPASSVDELRRVSDGLARAGGHQLSASNLVPHDSRSDESSGGQPADGQGDG